MIAGRAVYRLGIALDAVTHSDKKYYCGVISLSQCPQGNLTLIGKYKVVPKPEICVYSTQDQHKLNKCSHRLK